MLFLDNISFLYDGARIADEDTPDTLDMEDNGALRQSGSF